MRKRKEKTQWMTRHQLEVLDTIRKHGRRGLLLWFTNINLATIRSLAKRGFVDTASGGRILVTRAGKRRLRERWPNPQPVARQQRDTRSEGVAEDENGAPAAAGEASL